MNYVKVVFLRRVGAFVGKDGRVYGPYSPGDEALIPEGDAEELSLKGAAARIEGYVIKELKPLPLSVRRATDSLKTLYSPSLLLLWLGLVLVIVGFMVVSLSMISLSPQGIIWIFPFPPFSISGYELAIIVLLPIISFLVTLIILLYLFSKI
ncbi:MAG: hypothetical protein N3F04_06510 [Candidatus Nezhaarchaeota archaeon]|nr:hypothetical protein [Candidatus Nezhaarchaeota archaeon]MCX8142393.1 hypothetical protein [Candidatus Nezhaarchaeota archaeon]MDW8050634.1 hypothetical protein [Nitrososphaerota archaeon]